MHLELSDDQQILKQAMREFAVGEIAPGAAERDELGRFPTELIPKLAEQGLLGIMVPEAYGGSGYDAISSAIIIEEIPRVDAAVALLVGSHNALCSGHILLAGNDDQKRAFLPPLARGEKLGAWALTEPGSGDRKSTRLNSSHLVISYAVFCLKKKKTKHIGINCKRKIPTIEKRLN